MYIIRLDDASERRNTRKWNKIETILGKYSITPIVGVIPFCKDPDMKKYDEDTSFWEKVREWEKRGWIIALHGCEHVFKTSIAGINPVNNYSEFAGVPLEEQRDAIKKGLQKMSSEGIDVDMFFAPAHTYDDNTLIVLKEMNIKYVSDTIANDIYYDRKYDITFIPQQSGRVRKLPFKVVTFCYHPNSMTEEEFKELEIFIQKYNSKFKKLELIPAQRSLGIYDKILRSLYYMRRKRK